MQLSTLGLLVSSRSQSTDGALRTTYALVLVVGVLTLVPHALTPRRPPARWPNLASWLRYLSPIPAVMEVLGQGDVGSHGLSAGTGAVGDATPCWPSGMSTLCALATVRRSTTSCSTGRGRPAS